MKYGLKNIILHHSYFRNKRCLIVCHGHTNNTGANGAGKTSALQLVPVFYGHSPEKIVSKDAGKLSFLDYYLPHVHSFVAFEYERADGYACAVLYRHAKTAKLMYRFAKGRADETLLADFVSEHYDRHLPTADLFKLLEKHAICLSRPMDIIADYRAIISYDKARIRERKLHNDAENFCLSANKAPMNHIGDLTAVLLNSNQLLFKLREMLASIVIKQDNLSDKPNLSHGETLISTIKSLHGIHAQKSKLHEAVNTAHQLSQLYRTLKTHQRHSLSHENHLKNSHDEYIATKQKYNEAWQQQQEIYDRAMNAIHDNISEVNSEKNQKQKQIEKLDEQYREYMQKDMAQKEQDVKNLGIFEKNYKEKQRYYDKLNEGWQTLKDSHFQEVSRIENHFNAIKDDLTHKADNISQTISELANKKEQALERIHHDERQALAQLANEQKQQKETLLDKKSQAELAYHKSSLPTDDEQHEIDELNQQINQLQNQITQKNTHITKTKNTHKSAKEHYDDKLSDYEKSKKQLDKYKKEYGDCLAMINTSGTLLDFLDNHDNADKRGSHWRETIGKLINPELLMRQELSPEWVDNTHSFFGLTVNTDEIELPLIAKEKSEIIQHLEELKKHIDDKEQALKTQEKHVKECYELERSCLNEYQLAEQSYQALLHDLNTYQGVLGQLRQKHQDTISLRQQKTKELWERIGQDYDDLLKHHDNERIQKQDDFDKKRQDIKDEHDKKIRYYQEQIGNINAQKKVCQSNKQQALSAQDEIYKNALINKGVDKQKINHAKDELHLAEQKLKQVQSYQDMVYQYQRWLTQEYSQKDQWQDEYYAYADKYEQLKNNKETLKNQHESNYQHHKQALDEIDRLLDDIEQKQELLYHLSKRIDDIFESLGEWQVGTGGEMPLGSFELFYKQATDDLDKHIKLVATLKTAHQNATHALNAGEIATAWSERMGRYAYMLGSVGYLLSSMRELEEMLKYDIPQKIQASMGEFGAIANEICAYHGKIHRFNQAVKALSDKLSAQINHEHHFSSLKNIQIHLSSVLSGDMMFRSLKNFCTLYQNAGELTDLPDSQLLDEFSRAVHLLAHHHIDTAKTATLIELSVSCTEQGRDFVLTHHSDLTKASSTGISTMLIVILFASLTRHLCTDKLVAIHWPLDEIGRIDTKNTEDLFDFMNKQNIYLFCAEPELNPIKAKFFECKNDMDRDMGVRLYQKRTKRANPLLDMQAIGGGL